MAVDASDVIVFKSIRFRVSTLIRYVCVFICIHFQQRFQIDAFSVNTLSVFERISVDGRPKRIEMHAFSNENALVWTGSKSVHCMHVQEGVQVTAENKITYSCCIQANTYITSGLFI